MSIRMRHTRGHTANRRSHHALKGMNVIREESGTLRLPHHIDETTGLYRGKQIAPAKEVRASKKVKGATVVTEEHTHEHTHAHVEHDNADSNKGRKEKVAAGGRPKARSGMGGGA